MIPLTRRSFLQALGIVAVAPVLPVVAAQESAIRTITEFNLTGVSIVTNPEPWCAINEYGIFTGIGDKVTSTITDEGAWFTGCTITAGAILP